MALQQRRNVPLLLSLVVVAELVVKAWPFHIASRTTPSSLLHLVEPWRRNSRQSILFMGRKKSGKIFADIVELEGEAQEESAARTKRARSKRIPMRKASLPTDGETGSISPALAKWAEQTSQAEKPSGSSIGDNNIETGALTYASFQDMYEAAVDDDNNNDDDDATPFRKYRSSRREKQSARKAVELMLEQKVQQTVQAINNLLDGNTKLNVDELLDTIRPLLEMESPVNLRQLTSGARTNDYRLAWVGSDEALCRVGTGLHKVPLARLQEVFLSCGPRNRVQMLEVIRIIGPFPNVKNTLQGSSRIGRSKTGGNPQSAVTWQLTWDSMIDGTGKEILAGKEENAREVTLQALFTDPSILLVAAPMDDDRDDTDPLRDNGRALMVLLREESLDEKLESLRVA